MQLRNFQNCFKDLIFNNDGNQNDKDDFARIVERGTASLEERLNIYRNNVIGSITDVLGDVFPIIKDLVGEKFMNSMAQQFITASPPEGGCLNSYGEGFADFIARFEPASALPYLPDIARFEWALHAAYYAHDDRALTANDLASIAPDALCDLRLPLRDNVKLMTSSHPLTAIRDFCLRKDRGEDETLDLDQGGARLMICRPKLRVEILEIDEPSFAMLSKLQNNMKLGQATEETLSQYEDFDFQAFLQTQLKLETFLAFDTNI